MQLDEISDKGVEHGDLGVRSRDLVLEAKPLHEDADSPDWTTSDVEDRDEHDVEHERSVGVSRSQRDGGQHDGYRAS